MSEPTLQAGVGVVRDHVVAPSKGRLDIDLRYRRRVVRAVHGLPGRSRVLNGMHAQ